MRDLRRESGEPRAFAVSPGPDRGRWCGSSWTEKRAPELPTSRSASSGRTQAIVFLDGPPHATWPSMMASWPSVVPGRCLLDLRTARASMSGRDPGQDRAGSVGGRPAGRGPPWTSRRLTADPRPGHHREVNDDAPVSGPLAGGARAGRAGCLATLPSCCAVVDEPGPAGRGHCGRLHRRCRPSARRGLRAVGDGSRHRCHQRRYGRRMHVEQSRILLRPTDFDKSAAFYDGVGLTRYREWGEAPRRGVVYFLGGVLPGTQRGSATRAPRGMRLWLQVADVQAVHDELRGQGVEIDAPPEHKPWGLIEMTIHDPDGLPLVIVETPITHPLRRRS
jgi:catechol 2,3-dioxygenase-like lactoylglutathione lyase family enzyme